MMKNRKNGFTLAEVLITLTVIGVVAAISLPVLFETWDDQKSSSAMKKAMYTVTSGYKKLATDAEVSMANSPIFKCGKKFNCLSEWHKKAFSIASDQANSHNGLPESYVRSDSDEEEAGFKWDQVPYIFTTADGMTFGYISGTQSGGIEIAVDINGSKQPNKICKDVYKIVIDNKGSATNTYKDGDTTKSLCSKLNEPTVSCTADYATDSNICDSNGLANLYSNGGTTDNPDYIYLEGSVGYEPRIVCTSSGKVIAVVKEYYDSDVLRAEEVNDPSYAQYCP